MVYDPSDDPEGATPLDPDELEGLKFDHLTTRGELDELEQANIQSGLLWLERSRTKDILDVQFLSLASNLKFLIRGGAEGAADPAAGSAARSARGTSCNCSQSDAPWALSLPKETFNFLPAFSPSTKPDFLRKRDPG